jgi:hypothetical protein
MSQGQQTWCPKQEQLLVRWAEKAAGYRWLHNHARLHYKRVDNYLSYPSIVISSITGVGGFAVLNPSGNDGVSEETKSKIMIVQYMFAFLNVMGGILTSISKFSQSSQLAEAHSAMCVQYSKFYRNIDMELSLEPEHRGDVVEFVNTCRQEYDRLLDDAPDIPANAIIAFNIDFPDKENKPDVCNGLSILGTDDVERRERAMKNWMTTMFNLRRKKSKESLSTTPSVEIGRL